MILLNIEPTFWTALGSAVAAVASTVTAIFTFKSVRKFHKAQINTANANAGRDYRVAIREIEGFASQFENFFVQSLYSTQEEFEPSYKRLLSMHTQISGMFAKVEMGLDSLATFKGCKYNTHWQTLNDYYCQFGDVCSTLEKYVYASQKYRLISEIKSKIQNEIDLTKTDMALLNDYKGAIDFSFAEKKNGVTGRFISVNSGHMVKMAEIIDDTPSKVLVNGLKKYNDAKNKVFSGDYLTPDPD